MDLTNVSNQRRWTIVGLLFSASLINYLDRAAISFALPQLSRDFHLTPESKGLLLSSFFSVVRADAGSHWLVRRPLQLALALCRGLRPLVPGAGAYGSGRKSRNPDCFRILLVSVNPFICPAGPRL